MAIMLYVDAEFDLCQTLLAKNEGSLMEGGLAVEGAVRLFYIAKFIYHHLIETGTRTLTYQ
jgi:hypothetical protein